ncbi:MAG: DUF1799 domain-containing protein [Alphaproteobacteria bacterium]|nr:DUF1799 domain-containing protein [Alphaproteobacteria bacterium]
MHARAPLPRGERPPRAARSPARGRRHGRRSRARPDRRLEEHRGRERRADPVHGRQPGGGAGSAVLPGGRARGADRRALRPECGGKLRDAGRRWAGGERGIAVWEEHAAAIEAWAYAGRCWRSAGLGPPMLDWAQARALLEMAGVAVDADTLDRLLCLEAGALAGFRERAGAGE